MSYDVRVRIGIERAVSAFDCRPLWRVVVRYDHPDGKVEEAVGEWTDDVVDVNAQAEVLSAIWRAAGAEIAALADGVSRSHGMMGS